LDLTAFGFVSIAQKQTPSPVKAKAFVKKYQVVKN